MTGSTEPNLTPPRSGSGSKGAALVRRLFIVFKRMPDLRTKRTPLPVLVATSAVAAIAIATLGFVLSSQVGATNDLRTEFATKSDNYDSLRSDWSKQNDTISDLKSKIGAAELREENLTAAEAALTTRSSALDTREGAIKGAEDAVAANTFAGDGTFRVGTDILPGTSSSDGGSNC
ncbi:hypothetical protein [Cryobacterium sp. M15]|uniref:hypothetical protein n=1 Tax=Cryobacterium sp. M15 TaxID=2048291 RepID=UPI000CE2C63A|nr:hypothetical protein [Cryobacterium sp. M15]